MKTLYHSGRKKQPIDPQIFKKTTVILAENRVLSFTTQSESNFLLQSQIVYYCFVDCVTEENLTSLLMSGLNQI